MAKIFPTFENIERLKVQPTEGERHLLEYLEKNLPDEVEVYFQPFLNGDMPDIILMQKGVGVTIIEVKDWNLSKYSVDSKNQWHVKNRRGNLKSPFQQVYAYKDNMFNLHINGLLEQRIKHKKFYGKIKAYVYFHMATKKELESIYLSAIKPHKDDENKAHAEVKKNPNLAIQVNNKLTYIKQQLKKFHRDFYYTAIAKDTIQKICLPNQDKEELFTDQIYNEFIRYLQPPTHVLEQGKEIIYTDQQKKLIMSVQESIKIKGVAGSGKTNVLAKRAVNAHKRHGERVLILTYNITLARLIHDKISDVREEFRWDNFHIINYHEFFKQNANRMGISITIPEEIKEEFPNWSNEKQNNFFEKNYYSNRALFSEYSDQTIRYQTILIDEIQDYKPEWIKIIRDYFLTENGEIILFGDEKQNIYDRELDNEYKIKTVHGFGRWKNLTKPIRQMGGGDRIVDLSIKFQKAFFDGKYEIDDTSNQKQLKLDEGIYTVVPFENNQNKEIVETIHDIVKKNNIHPNDICILGTRIEPLRELDALLRKKFNEKTLTTFETEEILDHENLIKGDIKKIRNFKKYAFNANNGMLKLATIHSFKGYEAPTVFLIIHNGDSPELVYAAITRSKFNLMIFAETTSRYYEFFNTLMNQYDSVQKDEEILTTINDCIIHKDILEVKYLQFNESKKIKNLKPYKILFLNDNFYVACETDTKYKFIMLRLSRIIDALNTYEKFNINIDIDDFIAHIQTPFSRYKDNYKDFLVDVILEVDKKKSIFFKEKKFLASQEIVQEKGNGNLIIKYIVTQESEVEELIKKWIPYLHVIEPSTLDEKIRNDLQKYLYS